MIQYLLGRLLVSLVLLWGVLTLTFGIIHLAPGDPVDLLLDPSLPPQDVSALRARYGLDDTLAVQYGRWLTGVVRGDLGVSLHQHRPVADILRDALPMTLRLSGLALLLHFATGTALGMLSAARRASRLDRGATYISLAIYSMPIFWLGLMAQMLFAYKLRWLPSGGVGDVAFHWSAPGPWLASTLQHLVLPVLVLGLAGAAGVARFLRGSMLEILHEDYIRTARSKGLPPRLVLGKHALRNAAIPLVTLVGLSLPFLLSGSVVTEVIFSWPGMGRVTVEAIFSRDYPVIMATTMVSATLVILGSFLADLGYAWVDPRIRVR
jgi:peptide/nickel transport system permease protein